MTLKSITRLAAACVFVLSTLVSAQSTPSARQVQRLGSMPLSFEPNRGQTSPEVQWVARGPEYTLFLSGHDAVLEMSQISTATGSSDAKTPTSEALRMNLLGAVPSPNAIGEQPQTGRANYFTGADPEKWQRDVPMFGQVRLSQVYSGIDLTYYGKQGHLEYDFVVAPEADTSAIRLGFQGAVPVLTSTGDLRLDVVGQKVTLGRPVVFQIQGDKRQPVEASFEIASNHDVTFRLGAYDHTRALTIDPVLLFDGTFGSGGSDTVANALTVDSAGEIILTGATHDLTFPTTTGTIQTGCGTSSTTTLRCTNVTDVFVTKIAADGKSLVFSTYLSGTQYNENGTGIAVDAAGTIYVVGNTDSSDFPITSDAFQKICDPYGVNYVNGSFTSIAPKCGTTIDVFSMFLLKMNSAGDKLLYSTFLGGSENNQATGVALDTAGNIYMSGNSSSTTQGFPSTVHTIFPTTASAYQTSGNNAQFYTTLSKFSNDGHTLLYSTFLGAPIGTFTDYTFSSSLAVGANGVVFLGGTTYAFTFPTTPGVLKPTCAPATIATRPYSCSQTTGYVSAIDTTKSGTASLVYSTYIGPPSSATGHGNVGALTYVNALLADSANNVYLTGSTQAFNFPTTPGAYQTTCPYSSGAMDCNAATFLAKINPTGTAFLFSTFYGGPDPNYDYGSGQSLATDAKGRIYLYGLTRGYCDLPVLNPIQPACSSGNKVFISAFSSDGTQLLFGTRFGSPMDYEAPFVSSGIALDSAGNIYFGGLTTSASFPTTTGTYAETRTGGTQRTFFGKISPVLAADTITLAISPATTITGQVVTFTATVTGTTQTQPAPSGTVTLTNTTVTPAVVIGTIQLGATGSGTFTSSSLAGGKYQIAATYNADSIYDFSSTSSAQALTINSPTGDTVTLTVPATSIKVGGTATFNVTVAGASGTATPTGTVYFLDGMTTLGSALLANGAASYTTTSLAVGPHPISVNYAGDTVFGPASSMPQTVTVSAYAAALTFSASPNLALPGATISLNTNIGGTAGLAAPTGKLTILDGTTPVVSTVINGGTVNLSTTALAVGTHLLSASYSGDANYGPSASASTTVVIRTAAATTTVLSSSGLSANKGTPITFTAAIASTVMTGSPTGTVSFYDGTTAIGTGAVSSTAAGSGSATLTSSSLAAGPHSISAVYGGDTLFLASNSATIAQVVVATGFSITANPNPLIIQKGQSGMTTLTITPFGGYTGTLNFACSNVPQFVSCAFNPASLSLTGTSGVTTDTLTVYTSSNHGLLLVPARPFGNSTRNAVYCALLGLPLGLFGMLGLGKRDKHGIQLPRLLALTLGICCLGSLTMLGGCGGSANQIATPGTYPVPLSITSSDGTRQSLNLSIQIQ